MFKIVRAVKQIFTKTKSTHVLDSAEIRKLIHARFADEIAAKPRGAEENKKLETKSYEIKEHVETFTTCNIAEEFKELRSQGYDFAAAKKTVQNQNVKSLSERMKELSISGYISNYAGEPSLREDIEKVSIQKGLVINEFMERVAGKIEEPEEYSTALLG